MGGQDGFQWRSLTTSRGMAVGVASIRLRRSDVNIMMVFIVNDECKDFFALEAERKSSRSMTRKKKSCFIHLQFSSASSENT